MITEDMVEEALLALGAGAERAAKARAERIYMEEFRKTVKAQIMKENVSLPIGAQEREAYDDPRYRNHLKALRDAVFNDEKERWLMESHKTVIEAWRTQCSNQRANI